MKTFYNRFDKFVHVEILKRVLRGKGISGGLLDKNIHLSSISEGILRA